MKYYNGTVINGLLLVERLNKKGYALFQCPYCNTLFETKISHVVDKYTKSCGCQHYYKYNEGDYLGDDKTLLVKRTKRVKNKYYGIFKCSYCGKFFENEIDHIAKNRVKSCGCLTSKDLTGQRFGKLVVVSKNLEEKKNGQVYWNCVCDCGGKAIVPSTRLIHGSTQSCGCINSLGEMKISQFLNELKINYIKQKTFNDCINPETGHHLRFDFYLPDYNCCIEYDGIYHFKESSRCSDSLADRQYRDSVKNDFCIKYNIKLIRFSCLDYRDRDFTLENFIKRLKEEKILPTS